MDKTPIRNTLPEMPKDASNLLRSINRALLSAGLYDKGHPNALGCLQNLVDIVTQQFEQSPKITYMFTKEAIFVNDVPYTNSTDSIHLFHKLRMRGVLSITFNLPITCEQVDGFIAFLLEEPQDIRENGGPEKYLQDHGVTSVTLTEAIYVLEEGDNELSDINPDANSESSDLENVDTAVKWLTSRRKSADAPDVSLIDLLANTQSASVLIIQAVERLCQEAFPCSESQITSEIIDDFRELANGDREKWDNATPQIRKSISKLPLHLRPVISGFASVSSADMEGYDVVDVGQMESRISQIFIKPDGDLRPEQDLNESDLDPLFKMKTRGLLSSWEAELEPSSILSACGSTYESLLTWSSSREEHMRIAGAISTMVVRAMESGDVNTAVFLIEILIKETRQEHADAWRNVNARDVLINTDFSTLKKLAESALRNLNYHHKEISAMLVEIIPNLALSMISMLGTYRSEPFDNSLRNGVKIAGDRSLMLLTGLLKNGSISAKESALDVLVDIGSMLALGELASIIEGPDIDLACRALSKIGDKYNSRIINACHAAITGKSPDLQRAAIDAVRRMNEKSSIPLLESIAMHGSLKPELIDIRIEAIKVLGEIGEEAQVTTLERVVRNQPLIGRKQYAAVSDAAKLAIEQIRNGKKSLHLAGKE